MIIISSNFFSNSVTVKILKLAKNKKQNIQTNFEETDVHVHGKSRITAFIRVAIQMN